MRWPSHRRTEPESALAGYLEEARRLVADPPPPATAPEHLDVDADFETLRWFPLPDGWRSRPGEVEPLNRGRLRHGRAATSG